MNSTPKVPVLLAMLVAGSPVSFVQGQGDAPVSAKTGPPLVLVQTIPLPQVMGGWNHHSADGKRHRVFLCATSNKTVEVLDLDSGKIVKSLVVEKPSATCSAPDLNILAVSCGKTVQLFDAGSYERLASIPMPCGVDELRYDPRTKQMLAGCMNAPSEGIATIDLVGRKLLGEVKLPKPQGFCLEDDGNRVFVCTPQTGQISIADRQAPAALEGWKLTEAQGNYPVAYDAATHRLFVGCRKPAKLLILDTVSGKTVASVDTGAGTDDLSFDAANKRIYVACSDGVINVIQQDDADHYRDIATVTTPSGARNCVFVPECAEFCVTVPQRHQQSAEVLVFRSRK
jgi:DNA-binding beta-propeller fold protein YncE